MERPTDEPNRESFDEMFGTSITDFLRTVQPTPTVEPTPVQPEVEQIYTGSEAANQFLVVTFNSFKSNSNIRAIVEDLPKHLTRFKVVYRAYKSRKGATQDELKSIDALTVQQVARFASLKFEDAKKAFGGAKSQEELAKARYESDKWAILDQITHGAAENEERNAG